MQSFTKFFIVLSFVMLASCGGSESPPKLELSFTTPPIEIAEGEVRYAEDVRYGDGERNVLDIYLPNCSEPTGIVVYFHGGGFQGGDKSAGSSGSSVSRVNEFLSHCVAYATANYLLLNVPSEAEGTSSIPAQGGVRSSLYDGARVVQFLRYYSDSLNLDPNRVATMGVSAGAGMSLWLATRDDMANPDSDDPVARESSRIVAAGALATQSTYDILLWEDVLLPVTEQFADILGGTDVPTVAAFVGATNYLLTILNSETIEGLYTAEGVAYRAEVDMLANMDAGDAPIFVENYDPGYENLLNLFLHHGLHAIALAERADEVGLENVTYVEAAKPYGRDDPSGEQLIPFLLRQLDAG